MKPRFYLRSQGMNKLEAEYAQLLGLLKHGGSILDWRYEPIKLRLAHNTFYTPDFLVIQSDGFEFHETKGFMRDDAAVKLKVAAQTYPWFTFILVQKSKSGFSYKTIETA